MNSYTFMFVTYDEQTFTLVTYVYPGESRDLCFVNSYIFMFVTYVYPSPPNSPGTWNLWINSKTPFYFMVVLFHSKLSSTFNNL